METMQLVGMIMLGVGLVEATIGALLLRRSRAFLDGAAEAVGSVVGQQRRPGGQGGPSYAPIVRLRSMSGEEVEFASAVGPNPPRHREGREVPVRYDPNRPGDARIDSSTSQWLVPTILSASGSLFVVIGAVLLLTG